MAYVKPGVVCAGISCRLGGGDKWVQEKLVCLLGTLVDLWHGLLGPGVGRGKSGTKSSSFRVRGQVLEPYMLGQGKWLGFPSHRSIL